MLAAGPVSSSAIRASRFSRTRISTGAVKIRNTFTRCASRRASYGARRRPRAIPFILISGRITLSQPDLTALPPLPRDEGGPVFAEPWQAQAFGLAVRLSAQGHFTWKEWAAALADELKAAAGRGEPDDGSRYYEHWLATLE